jgi:MoaA/NifB/PqqE/SkfB family radical SAM enzyme
LYKYLDLKTVHLEITSKCNARCPMCLRTVCGGQDNPQLPLVELSLGDIKKIFPVEFVAQLSRMFMCGNYGDPIIAKDTLPAFQYFREHNPDIRLDMFTNGSARSEDFWRELARVIDTVHFSVDGLEDTNHLYRKGTHFPTIMRNVRAYLDAGGQAVWDFIVFRHNEHQIEEARALSKELGFKSFNLKKTGRFFSNVKMEAKDQQVVFNRKGEVDYYLEMPQDPEYHNPALLKEKALVKKYGSLENYLDQTPVKCKVSQEKSIYISAEGHAFPCCWTANQLYPWYYPAKKSYMWKILDQLEGGLDGLNAKHASLESIVNGPFFQEIITSSWDKKSIKDGKPKCCAKTCGTEFDPFNAQFAKSQPPSESGSVLRRWLGMIQ